jgi:hypothetical protein
MSTIILKENRPLFSFNVGDFIEFPLPPPFALQILALHSAWKDVEGYKDVVYRCILDSERFEVLFDNRFAVRYSMAEWRIKGGSCIEACLCMMGGFVGENNEVIWMGEPLSWLGKLFSIKVPDNSHIWTWSKSHCDSLNTLMKDVERHNALLREARDRVNSFIHPSKISWNARKKGEL